MGVWELCLPELRKKLQCGPVRGPRTWEVSEPPGRLPQPLAADGRARHQSVLSLSSKAFVPLDQVRSNFSL